MVTSTVDFRALLTTSQFAPGLPVSYYSRRAPVLLFAVRSANVVMAEYEVLSQLRRHARGTGAALLSCFGAEVRLTGAGIVSGS
jgi:hypothetical protein